MNVGGKKEMIDKENENKMKIVMKLEKKASRKIEKCERGEKKKK